MEVCAYSECKVRQVAGILVGVVLDIVDRRPAFTRPKPWKWAYDCLE